MSQTLPELLLELSQEDRYAAMQLQPGSTGQNGIWGAYLKVPHIDRMAVLVNELLESEFTAIEKRSLLDLLNLWNPMIECWLIIYGSGLNNPGFVEVHLDYSQCIEDMVAFDLLLFFNEG